MNGYTTDISKVEVKLGTGRQFDVDDALRVAKLRRSTTPAELTEKERSMVGEIVNDPVLQTRLRNWMMTLVVGALEKALFFVPFKKRIIKFVWKYIIKQFDDTIIALTDTDNGSQG